MWFRSTNSDTIVSFREAILNCLPPEGGLYVPEKTIDLRQLIAQMNEESNFCDVTAAITPSLLEAELDPAAALRVAQSAFNFEPELIRLDDHYSLLNLYKGPTGLFKDFGIAFLAAVMEELQSTTSSLVLSAARCNSGVSIARAFSGRKKMYAVLVYPYGPVYGLDPTSFITNGGNIIPIQINGSFDDCQSIIHGAINDRRFADRYNVTSANAINPGRLLPQVLYYLYAFIKIKKHLSGGLAFSVPCGNFGNLIAGLYAWKFGMPVNAFVAAMNSNNALGNYIKGEAFLPRPLITTNSPALDVSVPSNLGRLASFYREAPAVMRNMVHPASVDDALTLQTIEKVRKSFQVPIDSNTAVAFAAAEQTAARLGWKGSVHTIILATGHYAAENFDFLTEKVDPVAVIPANLDAFESVIANCF